MITKRYLQDLNAMMLLLAVDKYQSKRKVAEYTNTSIDTVNKYLRNLEHNLGLQLLINSTSGCHLTKRGRQIVEKLYQVSSIVEQIYNQRSDNSKFKGNVSVVVPSFAYALFSDGVCADFWEKYPEIKMTMITNLNGVSYGDVGADLVLAFDYDRSKNYSMLAKKELKMNLFAAPKYIEKYGAPKDIDDLIRNHRIIDYEENSCLPSRWKNLVNEAKHCVFVSNSLYAAKQAVENGWGIALLPREENGDGLLRLDQFGFDENLTFYLLINETAKNMPRVKAAAAYYCDYLNMVA